MTGADELRFVSTDGRAPSQSQSLQGDRHRIDRPQVNAVIRWGKSDHGNVLTAHFEPGEIRLFLHHEAVVGRPLEDAQADEPLDWASVAAGSNGNSIISGLQNGPLGPTGGSRGEAPGVRQSLA
jgi:hypothetical protein